MSAYKCAVLLLGTPPPAKVLLGDKGCYASQFPNTDCEDTLTQFLKSEGYCNGGARKVCAQSRTNPFVLPMEANLSGLPPLLIQVGTDELLLSDSLESARNAALEGMDVQLQVWHGTVHAWPLLHPALPTAGLGAIRKAGTWIAEKLAIVE